MGVAERGSRVKGTQVLLSLTLSCYGLKARTGSNSIDKLGRCIEELEKISVVSGLLDRVSLIWVDIFNRHPLRIGCQRSLGHLHDQNNHS